MPSRRASRPQEMHVPVPESLQQKILDGIKDDPVLQNTKGLTSYLLQPQNAGSSRATKYGTEAQHDCDMCDGKENESKAQVSKDQHCTYCKPGHSLGMIHAMATVFGICQWQRTAIYWEDPTTRQQSATIDILKEAMKQSLKFEPMIGRFRSKVKEYQQSIEIVIKPFVLERPQQKAAKGTKQISPDEVTLHKRHDLAPRALKRRNSQLRSSLREDRTRKEETKNDFKIPRCSPRMKEEPDPSSKGYINGFTSPKGGDMAPNDVIIEYSYQPFCTFQDELVEKLKRGKQIQTLALKGCEMKPGDYQTLLESSCKVSTLDFSDKEDVDVDTLSTIASKFETQKVILGNCRLLPQKLEKLKNMKCPKLDINLNNLGLEENNKAIAELMKSSAIEILVFNGCSMYNGQMNDIIGQALTGTKQLNLKKLVLTSNANMGTSDYKALGQLVNRGLAKLNISGCEATDEDIRAFQCSLRQGSKITKLDVSFNEGLTASGWKAVFQIVKKHGVQELNVAECRLRDKYLRLLIDGENNQQVNLPILQLSGNPDITAETIVKVARSLRVMDLYIDECSVNVDELRREMQVTFAEQKLRKLDISEPHEIMTEHRAEAIFNLIRFLRNLVCHYEEVPENRKQRLIDEAQKLSVKLDLGDGNSEEDEGAEMKIE